MITSSREKGFRAKEDGANINSKFNSMVPSSSRQWSAFKNPRIVRVSRAFGGKDRHSKVCTVRGLRDRRIRLSVPTAIQLYDLQDRLGLSQPSKVVDWLLDASKDEIDKLPPLQMPPGNFSNFHNQPILASHDQSNAPQSSFSPCFNYSKDGNIKITCNVGDDPMMGKSKAWDLDVAMRAKLKEVERETLNIEKIKWVRTDERENQDGKGNYIPQVSAQNFFPIPNHSSFPNFLNNSIPYNPFYHWEPSNLSLSQFNGANTSHLFSLPSSSALPSASQLFLSPPEATTSIFPPYPPYMAASSEHDTRQINHFLPNPFVSSLHSFTSPVSGTSKDLCLQPRDDHEMKQNK